MTKPNQYPVGSEVIVEVRFYEADDEGNPGDLIDPSPGTASIRWKHDDDVPVSRLLDDNLVTNVDTGIYTTPIVGDAVGRWNYRGESTTGLIAASAPAYFTIGADHTR